MSAPPLHKRPRVDAGAGAEWAHPDRDGAHRLLRSALGAAGARLAAHSAVGQSLVTVDEDEVDAAMTCFAVLLRDHAIEVHVAVEAARTLCAGSPAANQLARFASAP